jgi:hypothetical protein
MRRYTTGLRMERAWEAWWAEKYADGAGRGLYSSTSSSTRAAFVTGILIPLSVSHEKLVALSRNVHECKSLAAGECKKVGAMWSGFVYTPTTEAWGWEGASPGDWFNAMDAVLLDVTKVVLIGRAVQVDPRLTPCSPRVHPSLSPQLHASLTTLAVISAFGAAL